MCAQYRHPGAPPHFVTVTIFGPGGANRSGRLHQIRGHRQVVVDSAGQAPMRRSMRRQRGEGRDNGAPDNDTPGDPQHVTPSNSADGQFRISQTAK